MSVRTAHLADDSHPTATLCGLPWEDWQAPIPTNDEIGFDRLPYAVKVAVREDDEARRPKPGERVEQCQACFKAAWRHRP